MSYLKKEGGDLILCLYEAVGKRIRATVSLRIPLCVSEVKETDCLGRGNKKYSIKGNTFSFSLSPHEIKNFVLKSNL